MTPAQPPDPTDVIGQARSLRTAAEAVERYGRWAATYDHDVFDVHGFTGTARIVELLADHVTDRSTVVVDLGCGTGAAGVGLVDHGFQVVDGVDLSPEMLEQADRKAAYRRLIRADLTGPIPCMSATYGAAISAGTFTTGHVGPEALAEIVRILRPGATVAWVIGDVMWPRFEPAVQRCGLVVVSCEHEPIRRNGAPEAMMMVARVS